MKKILVPIADGFEEVEMITIVDVLRRAGLTVIVAGIKSGEVVGAHDIKLIPDVSLDNVMDEEFDMILLPGGQPGVDNLRKDSRVLDLLRTMDEQKKLIGAICAAPLVLRDAKLTAGKTLTCYPGFENQIEDMKFDNNRVVSDGRLLTSRGPGTAMEFSLEIVKILCGGEKALELSNQLLFQQSTP